MLQANRGRYAQARRTLATAAAKAEREGDVELQARIAGTTAYVLARLGDVDSGEKLCLDTLARGGLSPAAVAQLHGQLGSLALERGLLDDAAAWLTKSIRGSGGRAGASGEHATESQHWSTCSAAAWTT